MARPVRVAASQPHDRVDDVPGALAHIVEAASRADREGAALICFPECYLQGYVVDPDITPHRAISLDSQTFTNILEATADLTLALVVGFIERRGSGVYNSAAVLHRGNVAGIYRKSRLLPGETPVFSPREAREVFEANGLRFGINICYDLNFASCAAAVKARGGNFLVCPCNNMMRLSNAVDWKERHNAIRGERCRETGLPLLSADVTGWRGKQCVSWGPTALLGGHRRVIKQAPLDQEVLLITELPAA